MNSVIAPNSRASNGAMAIGGETKLRRLTRIALVGPDGVGKSTTIALLRERFRREFPDSEFHVRQWRPNLLPDLGRYVGKQAQTNKAVRPRRKPGRFHLLRVFYYYWDFLIGSWWKDRVNTAPGALVIYDRCALDMQVDPVRFALQSDRGTRFLARHTPRPDLVILLEDTPARIWKRKTEIEQHEMREQLERWRKLAERGEVHAIVRVNAGSEEIAARIWQLIVEVMGDRTTAGNVQSDFDAVEHLAAESRDAENCEFLPLPSKSHPRFLAPITPSAAAANSLQVYNSQTWLGAAWRGAVSAGLRTGILPRVNRARVSLPINGFRRFLSKASGCRDAVLSVSLGTPGIHRKPVFQVMDANGHIRAFAKVGWNEATIELVEREADALSRLRRQAFSTAAVPQVLEASWYSDSFVLIVGANDGHDDAGDLDNRHLEFLAELYRIQGSRVPPMRKVCPRLNEIADLGYHYYAHLLESAIQQHDVELPAGFAHGDFAPWNIRSAGEKLLVLDWEYFDERVPAAADLFHYLINSAIELRQQSGARIYRDILSDSRLRKYMQLVRLSNNFIRPLLVDYLAETLSSNLIRYGNYPSEIDQLARRTWAEMLMLTMRADGAAL